jgi:type I restriction enzyme, S subunit
VSRVDELIAELCPKGVPHKRLGEVGQFQRGRRFSKADVVEDGIPSIHYGEIYTHYGVAAAETVSHVRADLATQLRFASQGDVVIAGVGETVEDVGKAVAWLGAADAAIHDDCFRYHHSMDPKYVSYYLQTEAFHSQKRKHVARAKVKRLSAEALASIVIPVPPLEVQREIVRVLDAFKELETELEAELEARRRQSAHYRDSLLTFPEGGDPVGSDG